MLIKASGGDLRRSITMLDGMKHAKPVTADRVQEMSGSLPQSMVDSLMQTARTAKGWRELIDYAKTLRKTGYAGYHIVDQVMEVAMNIQGPEGLKADLVLSCSRVGEKLLDGACEEAQLYGLMRMLHQDFKTWR